jgi:hypothetical protein
MIFRVIIKPRVSYLDDHNSGFATVLIGSLGITTAGGKLQYISAYFYICPFLSLPTYITRRAFNHISAAFGKHINTGDVQGVFTIVTSLPCYKPVFHCSALSSTYHFDTLFRRECRLRYTSVWLPRSYAGTIRTSF